MTSSQMSNPKELITAAYPHLSSKQQRLAQFLLDNPFVSAFESANEIAARLDVSPATVVRFCQALGYSGYPEFQAAVRARFPTSLTAVERGERVLGNQERTPTWLIERVFEAERLALQRTLDEMQISPAATPTDGDSRSAIEVAAQLVLAAPRVLILGAGMAAGAATYFGHAFRVMGLDAHEHTAGGLSLAVELANAPADSVLITISIWRYVRELLEATQTAHNRGLKVVAIVDSAVSPLAKHADVAISVATAGVAHMLSLSGMMATLNALTLVISQLRPQETLAALRRVDDQYQASGLLLSH